ncbi:CopG family transcriptional regulator [Thermococcus sp. 2319x1]|uniref:CopG family transcriptional regulator n=1 Tax=Thermococcus sp. 2319x1 TaxID=1674923 RepID=UPI001582C9DD|nr:CopG family transcriptional regulator [Thermococcus sp. 2319x1]
MTQEENIKRIHVTFTKKQWELIENFRGVLGQNDAEIVRNIVLSWLSEKSIVSTTVKKKMGDRNDP